MIAGFHPIYDLKLPLLSNVMFNSDEKIETKNAVKKNEYTYMCYICVLSFFPNFLTRLNNTKECVVLYVSECARNGVIIYEIQNYDFEYYNFV